jgi:hypothetical protein
MKPKVSEPYKRILSLMDSPHLAKELDNYRHPLTLSEILDAFDALYPMDIQQFKGKNGQENRHNFELYHKVIEGQKKDITNLYNIPEQLDKFINGLSELSLKYNMRKLTSFSNLTDLRDILKDEETYQKIIEERERLVHGQLLDCFSVFTPDHFLYREDGMFLNSKSAALIRKTFGYTFYSVPDLTKIGFILDDNFTTLIMTINLETGEKTIGTEKKVSAQDIDNPSPVTEFDKRRDLFASRRTQGEIIKRIFFRKIIGISPTVHSKAIKEYNEKQMIKVSNSHKVKHKKHGNAKLYLNEKGEQVTVKEYAEVNGLKRTTAASRLAKMNKEMVG